jgi:predicted transcriptional regulator of viral defense system
VDLVRHHLGMYPIPWQAQHQLGAFTAAQAAEAGWSQAALNRAVRSHRLDRLRRGAYVAADHETGHAAARRRLAQQGVAASLCVARGTISHSAAAAVHGLPVLSTPREPCLTVPPGTRVNPSEFHLHRQVLPLWQLDHRVDISVTTPARACVDIAREAGLAAGLVTADAALARAMTTRDELSSVCRALRGRAGSPAGRRLVELADGRAESPLESLSRLAMADLRLQPDLQVPLYSIQGRFLGRVDFFWQELGVVGEADGREKYTDDELWKEKVRQDQLADCGLVFARWGWRLAHRPTELCSYLEQQFRRAELLRAAGIHPRIITGNFAA